MNTIDKKVTINDVARACGVSKTTISRYLNHKYEYFSEETCERIAKVIDELGYNPNRSAQRLKSSNTGLIGCIIGDMGSPFAGILLRGITRSCEEAGYQVLFAQSDENPQKEVRAIEGLLANQVDGLIVNTSGDNDEYLLSVVERGIPIVLADRRLLTDNKIITVEHNNEECAYECVKFLKECGYEEVAFFSLEMGTISPRVDRYSGYCRAMSEFYPNKQMKKFEFKAECEQKCLEAVNTFYKESSSDRIAILSSNGVTAEKISLAFTKNGWSFGRKFGLCTFDDWEWMKFNSGITGVSIPTEEIGATSTQLLLEIIKGKRELGKKPVNIMLTGTLNVRGSTIKE